MFLLSSKIREKLLKAQFPTAQYRPTEDALAAKLASIYGPVASGCMALQKKVGNYNKDRATIYKENEAAIKEVLTEMPGAEKIEAIFPSQLFWGISVQGEYVYLMFAHKKIDDIDYFNHFRKLIPEYMRYLLVVGHNIRSARQKRNIRNHQDETRTDTEEAR